jgi:Lipase (class 3)
MSLRLSFAAFCLIPLVGCAAFQQKADEVVFREPGDRLLGTPHPAHPEAIKHLQFAWLSEAAYGNTAAGLEVKDAAMAATSSATAPKAHAVQYPGCPVSQDALLAHGWRVWPGFPSGDLLEQIQKYHLRVEVWTRQDPPSVAVAFGGTVLNNNNDWAANFRWFMPKWLLAGHPDEYSELVQYFAPAFVTEYKAMLASNDPGWEFLKSAKIYSTGHSLGGGLAQQFAYALPIDAPIPVTQVFAFDPSPVTGFYSVPEDIRDKNKQGLLIDRVYERGEILAIVRSLTSLLVAPSASNPSIRGVRYALFYPAAPIAGHSITELACRLNEAAK